MCPRVEIQSVIVGKMAKTIDIRDSLVVTDPTTNRTIRSFEYARSDGMSLFSAIYDRLRKKSSVEGQLLHWFTVCCARFRNRQARSFPRLGAL